MAKNNKITGKNLDKGKATKVANQFKKGGGTDYLENIKKVFRGDAPNPTKPKK